MRRRDRWRLGRRTPLEAPTHELRWKRGPLTGPSFTIVYMKDTTGMLEEFCKNVGPGKKVIFNPYSFKVEVSVDSLAGYYLNEIQKLVEEDIDSPIPFKVTQCVLGT